MAIFQDTSNAARDLRILPSRALPLPRLSPKPNNISNTEENREVVVIGVSDIVLASKSTSLTALF
jgi:phenol 2-monooxygenase